MISVCMCSSYGTVLETVHLDLVFLCQANFDKEFRDVGPLVSLKLDHLAILGVVYHCAIASKFLQYVCVCVRVCVHERVIDRDYIYIP